MLCEITDSHYLSYNQNSSMRKVKPTKRHHSFSSQNGLALDQEDLDSNLNL